MFQFGSDQHGHLTKSNTVEPVYIEHSREMKKCSMYAGVQCIQEYLEVKYKQNQG